MGRIRNFLTLWAAASIVSVGAAGLAACRLPSAAPARSEEAREVRRSTEKAVRARLSGDGQHLVLRFRLKGRDAQATAPLAQATTTALTFHRNAAEATALLGPAPRSIPVFSPGVWRRVADSLALRVAPDNPALGTLILAGGRELVAHRVAGKGRLTPLELRPPGLKIVREINARTLAGEVFTDRGDDLDRPGGTTGPMVLLTGTFPELVFLDRSARRLVFLSIPAEEAPGLPITSWNTGTTAVRQLTSFVWRSHLLALLKNPVSTTSRFVASGTSIAGAGVGRMLSSLPADPPPPVQSHPPMDLPSWQATLSGICSAPQTGARLRLQIGGNEFFPAFIQAMQEARRSIDLQIYIFDTDDYAVGLANLMRQRSREGVRVRVLMDEVASLTAAGIPPDSPMPADFTPPADIARHLRQDSKVQVRCMPMSGLAASHTKIIAIDQQTAWLGGMNLGREYRYDWHDLMIEVKGALVPRIQQDFSLAWAKHGWGGDWAVARQRWGSPFRGKPSAGSPAPGEIPVQPLYTSPRKQEIAQAQLAALRRCQQRVWLENAYLSDDAFITALVEARRRGVDVRIVFPADNDNGIMAANNRALVPLLRRQGIRIYLLPGMSHIKAALYDGWACVGSANFDRLSLRVNHEFSIGFSDPALTAELENRLFRTDFQRSREITGHPNPGPADEMMNSLIRSLAGQL